MKKPFETSSRNQKKKEKKSPVALLWSGWLRTHTDISVWCQFTNFRPRKDHDLLKPWFRQVVPIHTLVLINLHYSYGWTGSSKTKVSPSVVTEHITVCSKQGEDSQNIRINSNICEAGFFFLKYSTYFIYYLVTNINHKYNNIKSHLLFKTQFSFEKMSPLCGVLCYFIEWQCIYCTSTVTKQSDGKQSWQQFRDTVLLWKHLN